MLYYIKIKFYKIYNLNNRKIMIVLKTKSKILINILLTLKKFHKQLKKLTFLRRKYTFILRKLRKFTYIIVQMS